MSNPITYDSLLVHHLARELQRSLAGQRIRTLALTGPARRIMLELDDRALLWELHPRRGWIRELDTAPTDPDAGDVAGRVMLPRQARIAAVEAVPDERVLQVPLLGGGKGRTRQLVVELMTNQWNALALDGDGRIMAVLWPRETGRRVLRPGTLYAPPVAPGGGRAGCDEPLHWGTWSSVLAEVEPDERRRHLVRQIAWTSPLNASAILGAAAARAGEAALRAAYDRYRELVPPVPAQPMLIRTPDGVIVYPLPLPGLDGRRTDSLLIAMAEVAGAAATAETVTPEALERLGGSYLCSDLSILGVAPRFLFGERVRCTGYTRNETPSRSKAFSWSGVG